MPCNIKYKSAVSDGIVAEAAIGVLAELLMTSKSKEKLWISPAILKILYLIKLIR